MIVAKNFRNIEEAKVGLTDTAPIPDQFDDQSKYADVNARTNFNGLNPNTTPGTETNTTTNSVTGTPTATKSGQNLFSNSGAPLSPGEAPTDGLSPDTFFTYQIVFVPDLTQKYGLRIKGGVGEIRAAMNLVNGWQFTGIGPYYMKDSATAQNILSTGISTRLGGQAVADVLKGVADLSAKGGTTQNTLVNSNSPAVSRISNALEALPHDLTPMTLTNYAEIHVYEPHLTVDGQMCWNEIVTFSFDRQYLGKKTITAELATTTAAVDKPAVSAEKPGQTGTTQNTLVGPGGSQEQVARNAVSHALGIPLGSPALISTPSNGKLQNELTSAPGVAQVYPAVGQINVDCDDNCKRPNKQFNVFNFDGAHSHRQSERRGRLQTFSLSGGTSAPNQIISRPGIGLTPNNSTATGAAATNPMNLNPPPPPTAPSTPPEVDPVNPMDM